MCLLKNFERCPRRFIILPPQWCVMMCMVFRVELTRWPHCKWNRAFWVLKIPVCTKWHAALNWDIKYTLYSVNTVHFVHSIHYAVCTTLCTRTGVLCNQTIFFRKNHRIEFSYNRQTYAVSGCPRHCNNSNFYDNAFRNPDSITKPCGIFPYLVGTPV